MTPRTRKLIGTIVLIVFLTIYALIVALLAGPILVGANKAVEFLFYLVAGLAWTIPAGILIRWMQKPGL